MSGLVCSLAFFALSTEGAVGQDTLQAKPKGGFLRRLGHGMYEFVKEFSRVDTGYVEPQHYNYTVMLQNTNTYEVYRLTTASGYSFKFAPEPSVKLGPYVGWRWVFLGYTLDLNHLSSDKKKTEFGLSLYSSQIGIDLFYRKTGDDYRIKSISIGNDINTSAMNGVKFDGLSASIKGFNIYYIFNHRKFSYPAAYSQSTMQKRSCGSPLVGVGYTRHTLSMDWNKLVDLAKAKLGGQIEMPPVDSVLKSKVKYADFSISGGYAYNYVFAPRWLFDVSLSVALAYNSANSDTDHSFLSFRDFSMRNFNLDGVGRFGIVWNNNRLYAGANAILHSYNYSKERFSTNNFFGSLNVYFGINFGKR